MADGSRLHASILDLFQEEEGDDDIYEPATEQSTLASTEDDETETDDYTGEWLIR